MISQITDNILIGGCDDLRRKTFIEHNITGVLNVARTLNVDIGPLWHSKNMEYQKVGLTDDEFNSPALILAAVDVLHDMTSRHDNVIVHCHQGQSRSATVIALYLARHLSLSIDDAVLRVRQQHHIPHKLWGPRPSLVDSIRNRFNETN